MPAFSFFAQPALQPLLPADHIGYDIWINRHISTSPVVYSEQ
jgi:hypothetical protein